MNKCLICYKELTEKDDSHEYHKKCCKELFGKTKPPKLEHTFDEVNELAKRNVEQRLTIPGVQPKLSLAIQSTNSKDPKSSRLTIVGLLDGLFILKPPNKNFPELPEIEALTMNLAEKCGITTAKYGLIKFKSGEIAYISKRFDRTLKRKKLIKYHQEDLCQLTGLLTENKYNSSMEQVAKVIKKYTTFVGLNLIDFYQIAVFSFLTGNADMHLKNFTLQYQDNGEIKLSPAYDLISTALVMPDDKEESALTINGKKAKLILSDFNSLADYCDITQKAQLNIHKEFEKKMPEIKKTIVNSFLSEGNKAKYLQIIYERAKILDIHIPENFDTI